MKAIKKISVIGYGITILMFIILLFAKIFFNDKIVMVYIRPIFNFILPTTYLTIGLVLEIKNAYLKRLYHIFSATVWIIALVLIFNTSFNLFSLSFFLVQYLIIAIIGVFIASIFRKVHLCK